ncbi:hypothetical protein [Olsenella massiliensis]|uniref:hypothetical protein n=1 Tax=Olsenella massiliensis TaxID=1622075 RepID=UPI0012E39736|nr:hypothetical protein [Olsenella massiliensis]
MSAMYVVMATKSLTWVSIFVAEPSCCFIAESGLLAAVTVGQATAFALSPYMT